MKTELLKANCVPEEVWRVLSVMDKIILIIESRAFEKKICSCVFMVPFLYAVRKPGIIVRYPLWLFR